MSCKQRVIFRYCKVMWLLLYLLCYNVANASEVEKVNVLSRTLDTKPVVDGKLAYNLSYQNWAHSQDLKEMSSYALSDGPDGYLWIASDSGLYKFDGTQRFLHSAYKDDSDTIFQLASDNEGYLWGVTARKVIVVDKELEVTTLDSPVRDYIGKVFVSSLTKDAQGNVWFEGLNKIYRASGGQLIKVFESTSEIIGIYGSQEAGFWMVSKNQAQRVNLDGQVVQTISFADIQLHKQFSFIEDSDNHVWLSQQNRVYIFDGNNLVEKYTLIGASSIDALFQYGNNILVASADGIRIISNDKERRIYFLETKIKERSTNATYVDAQRRIWVGGWRAGLHRLSQAELEFLKNSPFISMVSLKQEEGIYWVGGSKGLRKIDHEQVIDLLDQTIYGVVTGLEMNAEKSVLYAAFEHGIFEIDLDGSNAMKKMGGLDGMRIFEFALYKKGELLLGTDVGLLVYNIENESYKRPMSASEDASDRVYFIEPIADGLWLVGFRDDVFIFDGETLKPAANKKLNNIFDASYDPKTDSVLMIKRSDELEIFQWHRGRIRALPVGQVTKPFDPYNIHVDKTNHVWVQGEFKVVRISLKALYSRADFVPLQLFSHSANSTLECNASGDIFEDDDGVIYFPCYEGVYLIDSNEVPSLRKSPEPRFIAMHVNGQEVSLLKNTETSLPINSNQINVIVSAWSLENLNKLTYRYRFGNKESQWLPVDENKISLNYLSYGHYELELQAREGLGRWSAKKQLLFNVEPKFYQNFWFYCVVAAIAIFGFFVILQLRTSLLRKRSLNLQKTVEARTQSLQESNEKLNELRLLEIKHNEVELARKEQMNLELEEAVLIKTEELNHQVSKRIKFENEMQNAQKGELMGHMAGGLAHDLGNMLAVVSLNTYQLRKMVESALPTRQRIFDWVDSMDQAIKFCGDMVPKFQSLGRKDEYNPVVIDLVTVLNDLVDLTRVAVPEGVEIIKNLVENELFIKADEAEFRQTILNLVINASDACQEKGAIEICSERVLINTQTKVCVSCGEEFSINGVCVSIKDQGIGIAQDSIGHIFEHFYTTKNNSGGTGIGLAVVARCCHRANGHLTVKSKLGVGSEFKLYYPLVSSNRQKIDVIKKIEINSNEANVTKNNRVLLVEDSELLCMNIKRLMENVGIDVQTAFDGRQALDILEVDQQWDMVLTDYSMPNLNGAELVIEIRQQWPELKVVVMSGYPDENLDRVKDIVDGVLKKPFRPDDLLELLN